MMTYGDGVCSVDRTVLLDFHRRHRKLATITAVRPPARFGGLVFDGDVVAQFSEKPQVGEGWINGGFFVLEPECSTISTRTIRSSSARRSSARARRPADRVSPRRILAVHGHAA
jgi:NDP-sugar pyrophosphorylase family protein